MSQSELAKKMRDLANGNKWSQTTVWTVEKGERPLKLSEAMSLADVLGIEVTELMEDEAYEAKFELRSTSLQVTEALAAVVKNLHKASKKQNHATELFNQLIEDKALLDSEVLEFKNTIDMNEQWLLALSKGLSEPAFDQLLLNVQDES